MMETSMKRYLEENMNKLIEYCEANDMPVAQIIRKLFAKQ